MRVERPVFKSRAKGTYRIQNKASEEATVFIYDEIGYWGISPQTIATDLQAIKSDTIHLRLNTPGGAVHDGMAIYNLLKEHAAKVIVHIDGLAASIGSVIAMAGDEIRMAENANLMIHEPWSIVMGGAEDMRKEAEILDKVAGQIVGTYVARTGATEEQVLDWMGAETWFTAAEAKEAGFVDVVEPNNAKAQAMVRTFDLSVFAHTPDALKGDREPPTERDLERILRDAGCSRTEAKSILAEGIKARQRDAVEPVPEARKPPRDAAPPVGVDPVAVLLGRVDIHLATTRPEGVAA